MLFLSWIMRHHNSEQVLDWGQLRLVVGAEVVLLLWLAHQAVAAAAAAVPCACRFVHFC
jgi:hypothetical protein